MNQSRMWKETWFDTPKPIQTSREEKEAEINRNKQQEMRCFRLFNLDDTGFRDYRQDQEGETKTPHGKLKKTSAKGNWKEIIGRSKGTAPLEENVGSSINLFSPDLHLWICLGEVQAVNNAS